MFISEAMWMAACCTINMYSGGEKKNCFVIPDIPKFLKILVLLGPRDAGFRDANFVKEIFGGGGLVNPPPMLHV